MADVRDIATAALRELGVLAAGEVATADEADSAMEALNRLVDQWAAERLMIYRVTRTTWTIASGTQNYNVGTGSTVNVARPVFVDHVNYLNTTVSPNQEIPLTSLTNDAWALLGIKALPDTVPSNFFYKPAVPAILSLWPVPTLTTLTGVLYAPEQVAEFTSLDTVISLPPGYRRMLVKNLAQELGPSYERLIPDLKEQAIESKAVVKRSNQTLSDLSLDSALLMHSGGYDIETDS